MERLTVAKFGNSVIGADGSALREVVARVAALARASRVVAVVSAPPTSVGGRAVSLTDVAISCGEAAARGAPDASPVRRAWEAVTGRIDGPARAACEAAVGAHMAEFEAALAEAARAGSFADVARARALAHSGELPMSDVAAAAARAAGLHAAAVDYGSWPIITDENIESTNFVREASMAARGHMASLIRENDVVTIGGFVGRTRAGEPTTYERGGSDRTAIDVGILFSGDYDVSIDLEKDGPVASADPRVVDSAEEVRHLSHNEARIAGMFGMKILDPIAIKEMHECGAQFPVTITSMRDPSRATLISRDAPAREGNPLKIVTGRGDCAIVGLESEAAARLAASLRDERRYGEYVTLSPFTRAGIQYSRLLFLDGEYVRRNLRYLRRFDPLCSVTHGRGVITLIGDEMYRAQHVVARTGACIGEAGLNILNMDAQEETSRIIVIVEDSGDAVARAVRAIHARRAEMA